MEFKHISVMLKETVDSLSVKKDGVYVDLTAGGGGHSAEILSRLGENGRLVCFDRDPDAIMVLRERFGEDKRVTVVHEVFSSLKTVMDGLGYDCVDGVLADLGVSSYQLDCAERGFSVHADAKLDMRMSKEGLSAFDVVNTYDEKALDKILKVYGEEQFSKSIARNIVKQREAKPIETTLELAEIVKYSIPAAKRRTGGHPARKAFQAIRIEVNGELTVLENTLDTMFDILKPHGILSVITFHSLEDRMVKRKFQEYCKGCICPKEFPVCVCGQTPRGSLPFKFITASEEELVQNTRSRSATLRSIEKLHN